MLECSRRKGGRQQEDAFHVGFSKRKISTGASGTEIPLSAVLFIIDLGGVKIPEAPKTVRESVRISNRDIWCERAGEKRWRRACDNS